MENRAIPRKKRNFSHRTKTGCSVCRQRKIKCDEGRPSCNRCVRTGRKCPGYLDTRPAGSPASLPSSPPQIGGSEASQALIYLVPALVDKQGNRGVHFNGIVPHIVNFNRQHFPSRAGHNAALDAAMSCAAGGIRQLLRGECSKQSGSYYYLVNPSTELIRSHTSAVAALRYSLDDAKQSATAEILLAAFLLCCFETLEDNSEETVQTHIYGISKIYEHRGPPRVKSRLEYQLLRGCLPLIGLSCWSRNSPCFFSQPKWHNALIAFRDDETAFRQKWFIDNWYLHALTATLMADCSEFILNATNYKPSDYTEKRQKLIQQTQRANQICTKLRDTKIKELSKNDPDATLFSVYEELGKTKEDRLNYPINFLEGYWQTMIACGILRVALGGTGVLAIAEDTLATSRWLDAFVKGLPPDELEFSECMEKFLEATVLTADDWRLFAAEAEASTEQGQVQVVEPELFRRWLMLADIKPCG